MRNLTFYQKSEKFFPKFLKGKTYLFFNIILKKQKLAPLNTEILMKTYFKLLRIHQNSF